MRSGSLDIPGGQQRNAGGPQQRFEGPRSPPSMFDLVAINGIA